MSYIYIAYPREHKESAEVVQTNLEARGCATWLDGRQIEAHQDFTGKIEFAMREASHVVVVLPQGVEDCSDAFLRREINYALALDKKRQAEIPPWRRCSSRARNFQKSSIPGKP
jgi:hypothetical protein